MAISPTFGTSNQYIKYRIVVEESNTNIAANTSQVTVYVQAWRTNTGYTTDGYGTCYCGINGSSYSNSWAYRDGHAITYNSYTELFRTTVTIPHNADGTKSIWVSASISHDSFSASDQGFTVTLSTIPRYATSVQSLSSKTETTIKMNWSSNSTIDYVWYSTNNGSSWVGIGGVNATSGSYTISGLTANTTYNIKTRVRRKDSQLTTDSGNLSIATYNYPYASSMPNFTIGNTLTLGIYNPLGRSVQVYFVCANGTEVGGDTITGTTISGYTSNYFTNPMYQSIPNAKSASYKVKVVYGTHITTKNGGTYSVNTNLVKPSIGTVEYYDTEEASLDITNNDQLIIQDVSIVRYRASEIGTQKYASISRVDVTVNNNTYQLGLESIGDAAAGGNAAIDSAVNVTAVFKVTDSRGITATKEIEVQMLEYSLPTAIISLNRKNNYYDETIINVDSNYSSLDNNNELTIEYRYKKTTDVNYSETYTLQDNVPSTFSVDNNYYWNVQIDLTDKLGFVRYNAIVNKGIPLVFYDMILRSVGIECFPENEEDLEVKGISVKNAAQITEALSNYSTTEQVIGTWINGEKLYRKTISTGQLPFSIGYKPVNHNISDIDKIVHMYGYASSTTSGNYVPLPYAPSGNDAKSGIALVVTSTQIKIYVYQNQSDFDKSYVTLEYTKTN